MRLLREWFAEEDGRRHQLDEALICRCVVDADGNRLFRNSEVDTGTFDEWDGAIVRMLGNAIDRHCGFTTDLITVDEVEQQAKN